jgi:hypothetical protein
VSGRQKKLGRPKIRELTPDTIERIRTMRASGIFWRIIAQEIGAPISTLHRAAYPQKKSIQPRRLISPPGRGKDLVGSRFGRWLVLELVSIAPRIWRCVCDCGVIRVVAGSNLRSGGSTSCGCFRDEIAMGRGRTHGHAGLGKASRTYRLWASMLHRVRNKNNRSRAIYFDRGIGVCDRWLKFENFISDMGERPSPDHTIDRIDNDKGYSPENCRWATSKQQARNRRNNRFVEAFGERLTIAEWAERFGIKAHTIRGRLDDGWPTEVAVSRPIIPQSERHYGGSKGQRVLI